MTIKKKNRTITLIEKKLEVDFFEIIIDSKKLKIVKVHNHEDCWDAKYPYRFIYYDGTSWRGSNKCNSSLDKTLLSYLGVANIGNDSNFEVFATKMLGLEDE